VVDSKVDKFNQKVREQQKSQSENPFSSTFAKKNLKELKAEEYGRPKAGSLSEQRGKSANVHVYKEMLELCQIIHIEGKPSEADSKLREIPFGELFDIYVGISNKVVGLLLRARKYDLLTFEGECLFQHFHDHVPIRLLHSLGEIKKVLKAKENEVGLPSKKK
jgi:hypothetical protein